MRKLLFLLVVGAAGYFAYDRVWANPAAGGALTFPSRIVWRGTTHYPAQGNRPACDLVEVVAVEGRRWRTETTNSATRRVFVAWFDGQRFASSAPRATAEQVDPTKAVRALFAALPKAKFLGRETLDGRSVWHFEGPGPGGQTGSTWIDTETRFVAKVRATLPEGAAFEESYRSWPLEEGAERVLATQGVAPMLGRYQGLP